MARPREGQVVGQFPTSEMRIQLHKLPKSRDGAGEGTEVRMWEDVSTANLEAGKR